ncbi:UDP-N-acetylglucosamine 2-epimerase [uncultured Thalassospira sp.]|mgnify:CR=1 FL=1|uniref:UDP-N-acetylglucosamine 2-epimerase n=1 Tax=uncultured Thalassospira sp. TaxID=404382 RepID=UPI00258AF00F|nr:UDP-N-acetylglucosamine 2-epimerase [uncultured Thalassospira sp.]
MSRVVREVAVVTGSRADYGLLQPLIALLREDKDFSLRLLVTGAHLEERLGATKDVILQDGFQISAEVPLGLQGDDDLSVVNGVAASLKGFARYLVGHRPDLLMVLGDRYEVFGAVQAATFLKIPVAHIHGGELTEGAFDDALRHAITKMSSLHFVAAEPYRDRVVQMGEKPENVFNTGALGVDQIRGIVKYSRTELFERLGFPDQQDLQKQLFSVTFHPVTLQAASSVNSMQTLLDALEKFPKAIKIFTGANADPEGESVNALIKDYVARHPDHCRFFMSLGQKGYLSLLEHADCVIGNSSSGLLEAPSVGLPTVNIGSRQDGRLRAQSVIDCQDNKHDIESAISKALSPEYREIATKCESPFGEGNASQNILRILSAYNFETLLPKSFFDLPVGANKAVRPTSTGKR